MQLQNLPLGIQTFDKLILENMVYVDKTELIYQMISTSTPRFLSRPRRFGKSLLVSTLDALFRGKKELFKGLWIDDSDWSWESHPVIRFDMSQINRGNVDELERSLISRAAEIATEYGVTIHGDTAADFLRNLITSLSEIGPVVVLIDEYDKPILDNIRKKETARNIRAALKDFYAVLKAQDAKLRFIFLTGVTKFSQTSVFSGLNNLDDLSMSNDFSTLVGYTQDELKRYLNGHIERAAKENDLSVEDCYKKLKATYNGYCFSSKGEKVYNPFSTLKSLKERTFDHYWFETGTPTFLFEVIEERGFDVIEMESMKTTAENFKIFDIDQITTVSLLYQTGYLTIKSYDPRSSLFELGFPNNEVSGAFATTLINYFSKDNLTISKNISRLIENMLGNPWNYQEFLGITRNMLTEIPYVLHSKSEKTYHLMVFMMLKSAGLSAEAEVHTQKGRIDCLLLLKDKIILFEFKLNKSAKEAMDQIKKTKYYEAYLNRGVPLYLVAMNFNSKTYEMDDALVEILES